MSTATTSCAPMLATDDAAIVTLRQAALAQVESSGWPKLRHPSWQHTPTAAVTAFVDADMAQATTDPATLARAGRLLAEALPPSGPKLVFVDGTLCEALSNADIDGLEVRPLAELGAAAAPEHLGRLAQAHDDPLVALNGAALRHGAAITLRGQWPQQQALRLVFLATAPAPAVQLASAPTQPNAATLPPNGCQARPRVVIIAEAGCGAQIIEHHLSLLPLGRPQLCNLVVETFVGAGATMSHLVLHAAAHTVVAQHLTEVERDGTWQAAIVQLGAAWARQRLEVRLAGRGAGCQLSGATVAAERNVADVQAVVHHLGPRTRSDQIFRGTFDGHARGIFGGMVTVAPGASGTQARQLGRHLLMSPTASAHSQPQMEILTDDVRCSHGATVGQLDADALFFLQSRGIDAALARRLMACGFLAEALGGLPHAHLKAVAMAALYAHLDMADAFSTSAAV